MSAQETRPVLPPAVSLSWAHVKCPSNCMLPKFAEGHTALCPCPTKCQAGSHICEEHLASLVGGPEHLKPFKSYLESQDAPLKIRSPYLTTIAG